MFKPLLNCFCLAALLTTITQAQAGKLYSEYTRINLDKDCVFEKSEEYEAGGTAKCTGYRDVPVYFSEGDLRHQMRYGEIDGSFDIWETFSEFNQISDKIEWRIENARPYATILRWFINNEDPHIGAISEESRGIALVVSKVGTRLDPQSCIVGYIDARMNKYANQLARDVADDLAKDFQCGIDKPRFHGKKGKWSGTPTHYQE